MRKKSQTISNNLIKPHIRSFDQHDSSSIAVAQISTSHLSCSILHWLCMPWMSWRFMYAFFGPQRREKPIASHSDLHKFLSLEVVKWIFNFRYFMTTFPLSLILFVLASHACIICIWKSEVPYSKRTRTAKRAEQPNKIKALSPKPVEFLFMVNVGSLVHLERRGCGQTSYLSRKSFNIEIQDCKVNWDGMV